MKRIRPVAWLPRILLAIFACLLPLHAAETALDTAAAGVRKTVVTDSMMGYRDTLIFYVFEEAKAVLVVGIGNANLDFPITAKLHTFAAGTDAEAIGKWVNNQHSDGLFIDAADPESMHIIPAHPCITEKHEFQKHVKSHNGQFSSYTVTFRIKDAPALGDFKLKDFSDQATVFVKTAAR